MLTAHHEAFSRRPGSLDASAKTDVSNDYTVLLTLGVAKNAFYVVDVVRRKVEFLDLVRMVAAGYEKWEPSAIYVEDASNATALIQVLKRETHWQIVAVKPLQSKIARVEAVTGTLEAGNVHLPNEAPWLVDSS